MLAPTCMAQSHDQEDEPAADEPQRRSAMGRVMGIMIEALRQETLRDDSGTGAGARGPRGATPEAAGEEARAPRRPAAPAPR